MPGKVFSQIILKRLQRVVDTKLRENQAGFKEGDSCSEQIFALRNIVEQSIEYKLDTVINFIDFQKAFDSIHRPSIWHILEYYGIPDQFILIFKALCTESACCIKTTHGQANYFKILSGMRQGCILSPVIFIITIDFIMGRAIDMTDAGIQLQGEERLTDLDFADDIALIAANTNTCQTMNTRLEDNDLKVGLRISQQKTKILKSNDDEVTGTTLQEVNNFQYLGSYISKDTGIAKDIVNKLSKAGASFRRLRKIFRSNEFSLNVKLQLYTSIFLATAT